MNGIKTQRDDNDTDRGDPGFDEICKWFSRKHQKMRMQLGKLTDIFNGVVDDRTRIDQDNSPMHYKAKCDVCDCDARNDEQFEDRDRGTQ